MSIETELLKLLAQNPGDPTPGLILADYYRDRGDDKEEYYRNPLTYKQAWTIICHRQIGGHGNGHGNGHGYDNGHGYGYGYDNGDGYGHGHGYSYGHSYSHDSDPTYSFSREDVLMNGMYIYICDHGFVLVGRASPHPEDWQRVIIDDCSTIRRWGTERGLGQLAKEGPQKNTILDPEGNGVDVLRASIKRAIPCNEEAWKDYLS